MNAQLEYLTPPTEPRPARWAPVVAFLLFVVGGGATLLGCALGFIAGDSFYASRTDPNWTWGPNAYLLGMMKGFAYAATALVPAGIALVVVGWRLWRVRRVGT